MSLEIINVGVDCYNSYLILSDKNILIDTVKKAYSDKLIENISKYTDVKALDTVIINHTEEDRSGALEKILAFNPDITVFATLAGLKNLEQQLNIPFNQSLAKSNMIYEVNDELSLKFLITHNINWPDSMMTYCPEEKILFSCDAFSDESSSKKEYFSKNLEPVSDYVLNAARELKKLEISKICPGSGHCLENDKIINEYIDWCLTDKSESITVIFSSYSDNTKALAEFASKKLENCVLIDADNATDKEIYNAIYTSRGVLFGTPTILRNVPERIGSILCGLNYQKVSDIIFGAFGSYGWSGEAPNIVYSLLKARHFNTFKAPFRVMFKPTENDLCKFGEYLDDYIKQFD